MNVTIAGAGVVGCSIACELARRGVSVRVIDPRGIGNGATQASAGILAPAIEGRSEALLRLLSCSFSLYDGFVSRLEAESGLSIEYARTGTLQAALDDTEAAALDGAADRLARMRVPYERLSGEQARAMEPALARRTTAALLVSEDGYVSVGSLLESLAGAAARLGVMFETDRVIEVRGGAPARVVTPSGPIDSDAVIVAAGSWSSNLMDATLRPAPVRPIRGQLLRLRTSAPVASRVIWGTRCYVVPWRDGSVLVGATVEDVGFDERSTGLAVRELLTAGVELVPVLDDAAFEQVRVGLRPATSDELPVIGASSTLERVFHATGHYRNGVLLAPLTASLVADLVLEGRERDELALTRPSRLGL